MTGLPAGDKAASCSWDCPFESDTAITRHIAGFLCDQASDGEQPTRPTHVLFNGGVFRATPLRQRLLEVLGQWFPEAAPDELAGRRDLEFAVARGAAYYGWSKQHGGVRIRGGTARSYYIGIETTGLAVPGAPRPLKALCVVPFGMEEGTQIDVPSGEIGLVLGEPVQFRFFSSLVRKHDAAGDVLSRWSEDELQETDSLETCLPTSEAGRRDLCPRAFPVARDRARDLRTVVCQHQVGGTLETGVQRPRIVTKFTTISRWRCTGDHRCVGC